MTNTEQNVLTINGIDYVRADSVAPLVAEPTAEGYPFVIVRSATASPFAGYLKKDEGTEATLVRARRIRYWNGAMDLSEMSQKGVSKPDDCQFTAEATETVIKSVNEIHHCTEAARESIQAVAPWGL